METINNTDSKNGLAPPAELKSFARAHGWGGAIWKECPPHHFDPERQTAWFDWRHEKQDGGAEVERVWLTRATDLPDWVRRRYYVSRPFYAALTDPTCFCAVYETDGSLTEYTPEKEDNTLQQHGGGQGLVDKLPTAFDGDPKL